MSPKIPAAILAVACITGLYRSAGAAELAPNDPSIAADLALWLSSPDTDYDPGAGTWTDSSGNGNDATGIGTVGTVNWSTPTLSTIAGGTLTPNELDSVHFTGGTDDMLATAGLNGDSGLSDLTVIAVYAVSDRNSLTRPAGFGSIAAIQTNPGDHFNLASDPSLRKDNGAITGYSGSVPLNTPFIRSARMDSGGVDEWFNPDGTPTAVITNGGAAYTTSTDRFYLGDLRAGATPVPGFGASTSAAEIDVIEVIVYTSALTDTQISDINEWLVANLGGAPPPLVTSFTATPSIIASGESSTLAWQVETRRLGHHRSDRRRRRDERKHQRFPEHDHNLHAHSHRSRWRDDGRGHHRRRCASRRTDHQRSTSVEQQFARRRRRRELRLD